METGVAVRCVPMLLAIPRWVGRTSPRCAAFDEGMPNGAVRTHAPYLGPHPRDPLVVEDRIALLSLGERLEGRRQVLWAS